MSQLNVLIEQAASVAGSEYKLAKVLGIQQGVITTWKKGTRTCSAPDRAALAEVAKGNAAVEALEGLLEGIDLTSPKGQLAAKALREALEKIRKLYLPNPSPIGARTTHKVRRIRPHDPINRQLRNPKTHTKQIG